MGFISDFFKRKPVTKRRANPTEDCYAVLRAQVAKEGLAEVLECLADVVAEVGAGSGHDEEDSQEIAIELQALAATVEERNNDDGEDPEDNPDEDDEDEDDDDDDEEDDEDEDN